MLSAVSETSFLHCQLLMGVLRAGSASLWLYRKLSISQCCHTILTSGISGNSWEALPSTLISCQQWHHPPFYASLLSAMVCISRYLASFSKSALKVLEEVEPMPPTLRTAVLSVPLPFSFPKRDVASYLLSHTLQTAYSSSSSGGPCFISSVPWSSHPKQQGWLQVFTHFTAGVAAHWRTDAHSSKCKRRKKEGQNEWTCRWDNLFITPHTHHWISLPILSVLSLKGTRWSALCFRRPRPGRRHWVHPLLYPQSRLLCHL